MESRFGNIHLSGDEDDELILDDGTLQTNESQVDLCLVGRFLTDQPINFNLMRSRMAGIWRPGKGVFIKDIGQGRYIFQFFHAIDLKRIVDGGPWSFNNIPLILHQLKKGEFPLRVPLDWLPFWIQIHDLPAGYITENIGKQLGNFIGRFLEYDASNSTTTWRQYMRIRVAIDVSKPLKRGKRIKKPDGTSFVTCFKYERLHIFCFLCGRVGHSERFCDDLFSTDTTNMVREWGVWLKAEDRRGPTLSGDKWIRTENDLQGDSGSKPAGDDGRRGPNIFNFGAAQSQERNLPRINPHNHGIDNLESGNYGADNMEQNQTDYGSSHNTRDIMHKENDSFTLMDERKRRRSDTSSNTIPLRDVTNNVLFIDYSPSENDTTKHFLSAGPGSGVSREQ